jgi:hypothetical protein
MLLYDSMIKNPLSVLREKQKMFLLAEAEVDFIVTIKLCFGLCCYKERENQGTNSKNKGC